MPNRCENRLTIWHKDADVLDNLMAQVRADDNGDLFKYIKPMPDNTFRGALGNKEREECERKGIPNWYDWSIDNWGTKWDACQMDWSHGDDGNVTFTFNTAWSPPIPVYEALMEQGFDVEAYYVEYGCAFAGEWHYSSEDEQYLDASYNLDEEQVSPDLDEVFDITRQLQEWAEEAKEYA